MGLTISGRAFYLLKTPAAFTIGEFSDEEAVRYGIQANILKSLPLQ